MGLTDAQIKALQPRSARCLVSDGRGLSLDVLPSGVKPWMYRYRHDGKPQKVSLGRYPDLTLKAARDKRDELATQVVGGRSPADEKKARREGRDGDPTMREFGDRYYREQAMRNRKNPVEFLRYLKTYVYPAIGQKRPQEFSRRSIYTRFVAFVALLVHNGKSSPTQCGSFPRLAAAYASPKACQQWIDIIRCRE